MAVTAEDIFGPKPVAPTAESIFGPKPTGTAVTKTAEDIFGPRPLPADKEAEAIFGPKPGQNGSMLDTIARDLIPESVSQTPEFGKLMTDARMGAAKRAMWDAKTKENVLGMPGKILGKGMEMSALAKGPMAGRTRGKISKALEENAAIMGPEYMNAWREFERDKEIKERASTPEAIARAEERKEAMMKTADDYLGAPFRAMGGVAKGVQDWARYGAKYLADPENIRQEKEPRKLLDTVGRSVGNIDPIYMADVTEEAARVIAGRELGPGERLSAQLYGMLFELFAPGQSMKALRMGRGAPAGEAVASKLAKSFRKAGVDIAEDTARRMADDIVSGATHPERVAKARRYARKYGAKQAGKEAGAQAERTLIQKMGEQGKHLETSGLQARLPMRAKRAEAIQKEVTPVALGAERTGVHRIAPVVGDFVYGAGLPKGTAEALRPSQAFAARASEEAVEGGRAIEKAMVTEARSSEVSTIRDMQYNLRRRDEYAKAVSEAKDEASRAAATDVLAQKDRELVIALKRSGLSESEARAGYEAASKQEKQMVRVMDQDLADMRKLERQYGIDVGKVDSDAYVYRDLSPEAKRLRREVLGGKGARKAEKFTKGRQEYLSTSVGGGTRNIDFEQRMGHWYASRKKAHALAVSNKMAERQILRGYGRRITDNDVARWQLRDIDELANNMRYQADLERRGLKVYEATDGARYVLDSRLAKTVEKMLNPDEMGKYMRGWTKINNWWKARATVLRPGFVFRNVLGGNIWQLWQADVDIIPSMARAAKAMRKISQRGLKNNGTITRTMLKQIEGNATKDIGKVARLEKVGKYTLDEAIDIGLANGVEGGGFFGAELGHSGKMGSTIGQAVNPFSSKFGIMQLNAKANRMGEDMARWALFLDKLGKGYSPRESASWVAKYIFNYNELAAFGKGIKQVIPFATWNFKNWGMQITSMLNKPDKFLNFSNMWHRIQDLDPLTEDEQANIPDWAERSEAFFMPFKNGKEGERQFFLGGGIFPVISAKQLAPDKILPTLGTMVQPILRSLVEEIFEAADEESISFFGTNRRPDESMVRAPNWIVGLMDWARDNSPNTYALLADEDGLGIEPTRHYFTGTPDGYKWDMELAEKINTFDPGMGLLNRLFRHSDERMYNTFLSTIFGFKLYDYTEDKQLRYREEKLKKIIEALNKLRKKRRQTGTLPPRGM